MTILAPIEWGGPVSADTQGVEMESQALGQREKSFAYAHELGANIEGGAKVVVQGILHNQALAATAQLKEKQANTLKFIESNNYVSKADLQQRMAPEDFESWSGQLGEQYKDKDAVPMWTVAGELFDSEAKKARDEAGKIISLPGWRDKWSSTERTESSTIRERYVNRPAADQMFADQQAQAKAAIDSLIESGSFDEAAAAARGSPWLRPPLREAEAKAALAGKDAYPAQVAMRTGDVKGMNEQLTALRGADAAEKFPNLTEKQRLTLTDQLRREYGYHAARQQADSIVSPHVDVNTGKVDSIAIAKDVAAYRGENREEVVKAAKMQEVESLDLWNKKNSEVQKQLYTAGQNPQTGEFSYSRMMKTQGAPALAAQLNQDAPDLLGHLRDIDNRNVRAELAATAAERRMLKANDIAESKRNVKDVRSWLDDERNAVQFKAMTPSQWQTFILDVGHLESGDHDALLKDFDAFQKRGGRADERVEQVVSSEMKSAVPNENPVLVKRLDAQYGDTLRKAANGYLREHADLPPDKLTDGLREFIKTKLIKGSVVGGGSVWGDANGVRRIEWESNSDYAKKPFQTSEGKVLAPADKRPTLTIDGETRYWDGKAWVEK